MRVPDILRSPWLTHSSLVALTLAMFFMLRWGTWWLVLIPCILIHHRLGILLHEYVHGIPLRRYRDNLRVLSVFDGILLSFGMLEVFRASHLAHHRWLNTDSDPAMYEPKRDRAAASRIGAALLALELPQHVRYLRGYLRAERPYVQRRLILSGALQSLAWIALWLAIHQGRIVWMLLFLNFTTSIVSSFRGAVEHHSHMGDKNSTNEYEALVPLFNLNRHIDHHAHPTRPWYLLQFVTAAPLRPWKYWTHWYHAYIKGDYSLMSPESRTARPPNAALFEAGQNAGVEP